MGYGPGFDTLRVGPWTAWLQAGTLEADLYARAWVARWADLPLGSGEGVTFWARQDSDGRSLDGRCFYRIEDIAPASRWWTLTLYDRQGNLVSNPARRHGFNSTEIVRFSGGQSRVVIGPTVSPGNWIPSPKEPIWLVLRLYDTRISTGLTAQETVTLPTITREACL